MSNLYSVWVGGAEVNDHLLNKEEAYALAHVYKEDGYDDVQIDPPITARRYTIHHVATCCSDYFGGHHLPNFSIMVTGESTYDYLKEVMLDWQTTDHLDHELFRDSEDYNNFRDAVEELFQDSEEAGTMQDTFDPRIDTPQTEEEWDYWDVNAFFAVEMEEDESVVPDTTGEDHAI
jgi:hypothetical protein